MAARIYDHEIYSQINEMKIAMNKFGDVSELSKSNR
jgi:hypothetical protein